MKGFLGYILGTVVGFFMAFMANLKAWEFISWSSYMISSMIVFGLVGLIILHSDKKQGQAK